MAKKAEEPVPDDTTTPAGPPSLSETFKQRLIEEQAVRGYTDAGLAHRASKFHPIAANTIWQIKKRGRRVDVDEANAIACAFGFRDVNTFVQTRPEYAEFQETFWALWKELGALGGGVRVDSEHPMAAIQNLGWRINRERTAEQWREIRRPAGYNPNSLGDPQVMVRELRQMIEHARSGVDEILDEIEADLNITEQNLKQAEEGATK